MSNPKDGVVKKEGSSNRNSSEVKKLEHYWECNKNHVARVGKDARDGCREFMASSSIAESDGKITTSLTCEACGCHRNFHRKKEEELGVEWQSGNKVRYGECHKNHWAQRGKYVSDGCTEFIGSSDDEMGGGLKCDACGCHRNFHETKVVEVEDGSGGADDDNSKAGLYENCCKNHAMDMGKYSYTDGCLEFMASSTRDADLMKCDACGCHRNFHKRKEVVKEERLRKRPAVASPYYSSDYNDDDDNYVDDADYYD